MTGAVLARKSAAAPAAETKSKASFTNLRIAEPTDAFEREADRVADEVMVIGGPRLAWSLSKVGIAPLQRKCACGGSAGECDECKEKKLQRRAIGAAGPSTAPPIVYDVLRSPGQPLDAATRAFFEPRLGQNLGGVRVHADARAAESAHLVHALAYTVGSDVAFGAGQYTPGTAVGRRLIAHELVHTLQQRGAPAPVAELSTSRRDDLLETQASHGVEELLAGRPVSIASASDLVLSRQDKGPSLDTPEEREEKRKKQELLESTKSVESGRPIPGAQYTWGWGGAETKNVYQECKVTELERPQFLTLFKSLPAPTSPRPRRQRPHDAEEALGVTQISGRVVPPEIAASAVPGGFKLKPTHAEMPSIYSAYTKAGEYIEGTRQCTNPDCAFASRGTSKFPLHWRITPGGAALLKQGEQEHCNDIKAAFDLTLALYASVLNNLAAAERLYSSEKQAVDEAISYVKVPPDAMIDRFVAMAEKTELRDNKGWHTTNDSLPPRDPHSQFCTLDNGCRAWEIIDEKSLPEIGKHPPEEVLTPPARPTANAPTNPGRPAPAHIQRKCEESHAPPAPPLALSLVHEVSRSPGQPLEVSRTGDQAPHDGLPAIVREVLDSPGQPLDADTREFFEPRFRHEFGKVRIHADSRAAESAQAVNALAYTVGNHISFGADAYRPQGAQGRKLIAHELAHVVQQSQNAGPSSSEAHLEADADRAASTVISRGFSSVAAGGSQTGIQRQQGGGGAKAPVAPPNAAQQRIIDDARRAAAIRCQTALFRVRGVVPGGPPRAIDQASETALRARSLARLMFDWDNPNMEQVGDVIGNMVNFLTSGVEVKIAGAGDSDCGPRAAYVRGLRPPIILCPAFFSGSAEQRIRTMIHESAHLARIGSADLGESYCVDFDCATSCGGFSSADSWAHFVHCLSDQKPDKPITITGRASRGGQGQAPSTTPQQGTGGKP